MSKKNKTKHLLDRIEDLDDKMELVFLAVSALQECNIQSKINADQIVNSVKSNLNRRTTNLPDMLDSLTPKPKALGTRTDCFIIGEVTEQTEEYVLINGLKFLNDQVTILSEKDYQERRKAYDKV